MNAITHNRSAGVSHVQALRTGYFSHPACKKHDMGAGHPECPARLDAIEDWLLTTGVLDALDRQQAPFALQADLERAHTDRYLTWLTSTSARLINDLLAGGPPLHALDPDTYMGEHTLTAALAAAGAAIEATHQVITGQLLNAFCAIRPPGHHALADKGMGFCFINNVAVAAKYALAHHGLQRVAIVDFDVHHGNGTEDIIANDPRIMMVGFYQHPLFPYHEPSQSPENAHNVPVAAYSKGMQIRELVSQQWLSKLHSFEPQMIFISAGFDAHRLDDLGQLGLEEQDYAWITLQIKQIADQYANGRIVSCLEGGYHLQALARSVEAHVRVLADL